MEKQKITSLEEQLLGSLSNGKSLDENFPLLKGKNLEAWNSILSSESEEVKKHIYNIWERVGKPSLKFVSQEEKIRSHRGYYVVGQHKIAADDLDTLMEELGHAYQYKGDTKEKYANRTMTETILDLYGKVRGGPYQVTRSIAKSFGVSTEDFSKWAKYHNLPNPYEYVEGIEGVHDMAGSRGYNWLQGLRASTGNISQAIGITEAGKALKDWTEGKDFHFDKYDKHTKDYIKTWLPDMYASMKTGIGVDEHIKQLSSNLGADYFIKRLGPEGLTSEKFFEIGMDLLNSSKNKGFYKGKVIDEGLERTFTGRKDTIPFQESISEKLRNFRLRTTTEEEISKYQNLEFWKKPEELIKYQDGGVITKEEELLKGLNQHMKVGGITQGEFSHKTNPLTVVDEKGNDTGMELTGGEGVFDKDAMKRLDVYKKQGNLKEAGKLVFAEMDSWIKSGTAQNGTTIPEKKEIYPWDFTQRKAEDIELWKNSILGVEASGNRDYSLIGFETEETEKPAIGPYQFIYNHHINELKKFGVNSRDELIGNKNAQEQYMTYLLQNTYPKNVETLRKFYGPGGEKLTENAVSDFSKEGLLGDLTDEQLMAMIHFVGHEGTKRYFKNKREGKGYKVAGQDIGHNLSVEEYLKRFNKTFDKGNLKLQEKRSGQFLFHLKKGL